MGKKTKAGTGRRLAKVGVFLAALLLASEAPVLAQGPQVGSNLSSDFVDRESPIEVTFDRAVLGANDRIVVFVGQTDITDLFEHTSAGLRYAPLGLPLSPGSTEFPRRTRCSPTGRHRSSVGHTQRPRSTTDSRSARPVMTPRRLRRC